MKNIVVKKYFVYLAIFIMSCASVSNKISYNFQYENITLEYLENDSSYDSKLLYAMGFPEKIDSVAKYESACEVLSALLEKDCAGFPRFNSENSGVIFQELYSKKHLLDYLNKHDTDLEKKKFLYSIMFNDRKGTDDLYAINFNEKHSYENEIILISSYHLFAQLLFWELVERDYKSNKDKPDYMDEQLKMASKFIGRGLLGLKNKMKLYKLDSQVVNIINSDIEIYEKMISKSGLIDINIVKDEDNLYN